MHAAITSVSLAVNSLLLNQQSSTWTHTWCTHTHMYNMHVHVLVHRWWLPLMYINTLIKLITLIGYSAEPDTGCLATT